MDQDAGWRCLKGDSPFEFDPADVISDMATPLARSDTDLSVVATQDSDYPMVREGGLERATYELARAGFSIDP